MKLVFKKYNGEEIENVGELYIVNGKIAGDENLLDLPDIITVTDGDTIYTPKDGDKYLEMFAMSFRTPYFWSEVV